jgi:hypothetical protein
MKLRVAGEEVSESLGVELAQAAAARADHGVAGCVDRESPVLSLREARDEGDYLDRHVTLLGSRNCVDLEQFEVPAGAGRRGQLVKRVRESLWKILRTPHDWYAFRQNAINIQLACELAFEKEDRARAVRDLTGRLEELESRLDAAEKKGQGERR